MVAYTTTYNLKKPTVADDEDVWGGYLNDSMDLIDDVLDGTTPVTGIDINSGTLDNVVIGGATANSGTFTVLSATTSLGVTGNITVSGTVDGRDVAADGTKLDGIEASADVTDTANVTAAGALMDSEVTNLAQVKAFSSSDYATAAQGTTADAALARSGGTMTGAIAFAAGQTFDGRDVSADGSKLDGIESGATADQTKADIDALNIAASTSDQIYINESSDDNTSYNVLFENTSGTGNRYGSIYQDDGGLTFNPYTNTFSVSYSSFTSIYLASFLYHTGDTNTYIGFTTDNINFSAGGETEMQITTPGVRLTNSALHEDYDVLSGTSPSVDPNTGAAWSLTMTGNTTFTFGTTTSGYSTGIVIELTGNGSTVTWPSSVDWAGGTAPDAPASGETDIYVFWTRDGGTTWYGVQSIDAAA